MPAFSKASENNPIIIVQETFGSGMNRFSGRKCVIWALITGGIAFLILAGLSSCSGPILGESAPPVQVAIPALPAQYEDLPGFQRITWWDGAAIQQRRVAITSSEAAEIAISLEIAPRGAALVVICAEAELEPAPGVTVRLSPYGGWASPTFGATTLRRERGELAAVLLRLAERGLDPSLVNVERLARRVVAECGTEGTRLLDTERLSRALGSGEMRSSEVDALAPIRWEFRREGDATEVWLTDEPAAAELTLTPAGGYVAGAIELAPRELRRFWREAGAADGVATAQGAAGAARVVTLLTVAADEDDHVTAVLTHYVVDELVRDGDHLDDLLAVQKLSDPLVGGGQ